MTDYAIVKIAHRQYIVEEGKTYTVDKFPAEVGTKHNLPVLAMAVKDELKLGNPTLENVKAEIEIADQAKGEKINGLNYQAKARKYRRFGKRKLITTFKVISIK